MSKDLFSDFLYIDTYDKDNRSAAKHKQLLNEFKKEYRAFTPLHEIHFPKKAYSPKLKYYERLIDKETSVRFNEMITDLDRVSTDAHLKFLYQKWYNRFSTYLMQISEFIKTKEYKEVSFLKPSNSLESENAHAIFYLKANAILLFLELQDRYSKHGNDNVLSQKEIHEVFYHEEPPKELYVRDYTGSPVTIPKSSNNVGGRFNAIKADLDFRSPNEKVLTYPELIKVSKADAFARLEERLVEEGFIDDKYSFKGKRGNKQVIAAFLLTLFEKGYFNERFYPDGKPSKKIERKHITKFFAHRYGTGSNCDKEYRNFQGALRSKYDNLLIKHPWLDQIS